MAIIDPVTGAISYAAFYDSFDAGTVNFPDTWNVDTSVPGQVTLNTPEWYLNSGMMEKTGLPSDGHGYGTYTVNAKIEGSVPGPAIMLWPGDNQWPGSEMDFGELAEDGSGRQYASLHWNWDGRDQADVQMFSPDIKTGVFHEYQLVWEPGRVTVNVDDVQQVVYERNIPMDYANGGMDQVFAFLNLRPDTSLTILDVSYVPLGAPAPAAGGTAVASPAPEAPIDWDALGAWVTANYEATGYWTMPETWPIPATGTTTGAAPAPTPAAPAPTPAAPPPEPIVVVPSDPAPAAADPYAPDANGYVDWEAIAARVTANHEATGYWFY